MSFEPSTAASVRSKMESLRLECEREIETSLNEVGYVTAARHDSLASFRAKFRESVQFQRLFNFFLRVLILIILLIYEELGLISLAKLREAEEEFFKALVVKTRKEAKRMAMMDAVSARRGRIEELKRAVQDRRAKWDEYAAILIKEFSEFEDRWRKEGIEEAISWYNEVLGFHIEGGHGVRFMFKNINSKNPDEEFSFTVRLANDEYTLLDCDPHLNEIKGLNELNRTNGLFKFVRDMRQRFQEAASRGLPRALHQEYSTISGSAPSLSVSTISSECFAESHEQLQVQHEEPGRKVNISSHGMEWKANQIIYFPGHHSLIIALLVLGSRNEDARQTFLQFYASTNLLKSSSSLRPRVLLLQT